MINHHPRFTPQRSERHKLVSGNAVQPCRNDSLLHLPLLSHQLRSGTHSGHLRRFYSPVPMDEGGVQLREEEKDKEKDNEKAVRELPESVQTDSVH